jgi:ubiquinone/menaquinone biosynthesis C-methylase UbiE
VRSDESEAIVAAGYDAVYRAVPRSPTLWRIWLDHAAGADFPGEYSHISFVTLAELRDLAGTLRFGTGATLVDLACGMGGPSLWIATQHAVRVNGIDASAVAVELANARAARLELADRCAFRTGTFGATGLPAASADAAMSLDALQYAPSKADAFREMARVLKPNGRLAFTAFEVHPDRVADLAVLGDDPVSDYRPLLEGAGFAIDAYDETPGWSERVAAAYEAILESAPALTSEMGADAYASLALEVGLTLERRPYRRRVTATASRQAIAMSAIT